MELYTYFRSSAAYRVRIACALKGVSPTPHFVHLLNHGGEQKQAEYSKINPNQTVPTLVTEEGAITQSLAILEYLEERYPNPPLLPVHSHDRAFVRSIALTIACDIHPINNLRVLQYLTGTLGIAEDAKNTWYQHWVMHGLNALESQLANHPASGDFCHGDQPTFADICLIPQLYNARRFKVDLSAYPTLTRIESNCLAISAFIEASPEKQPDYQ
ncbi:maleylacetoacetate isomerase [Leeia sp. TBRC 13508]|uniref:Maleylacetoacetate isomerase n=1 Tax=Leeia speluncae TaxID=2884804 RepID=A0ABS8D3C1_9NEIS|nr:maleylacetoacetate isomerase [Leeia speluncae]MCB6182692.1 maleylacetoacetate isomerase [Leeia speluncae]